MYGGVLGSKGDEAPKQSPEPSEDNVTEYDGVSSANVLGRSTLMQTSRLSTNIIKNLRSLRYEVLSTNMHWKVNTQCWYCQQYKYSVIFYQRSVAETWFKKVKLKDHVHHFDKEILKNFQKNIDILNSALDQIEDDELPDDQLDTILDPVLIGNFEVQNHRQLKNPHEYLDKMIREEIIDQATKKLADIKASLKKEFGKNKKKINEEYKKHFMVAYDDMMK